MPIIIRQMIRRDMDALTMNNLTCLLITCNKPAYLLRALAFYSQTDICIDIYDGSSQSNEELVSPYLSNRIKYNYHPDTTSVFRLTTGVKNAKTDFIKMIADDDYSLYQGLVYCVNFLKSNEDFIACFGITLAYEESNSHIEYFLAEQHSLTIDLSQNHYEERIGSFWASCPYALQHSVFRRTAYLNCLSFTHYGLTGSGENDYNLFERVLLTSIVALGKCKMLHIPYMFRESRANTEGARTLDLQKVMSNKDNANVYHLFLLKLEMIAHQLGDANPFHFAKSVESLIIKWESSIRPKIWNHPLLFTSTWTLFSDKPALFFEPKQYIEYGFYTPDFFNLLYDLDFRTRCFALCSSNPLHANFNWKSDNNQLIEIIREQPFHIYALQSLQEQFQKYPDQAVQINLDNWLDRIYSTGIQQLINK